MKIKDIVYTGLFIALITVGAFIKLPISLVPVTLQSMMVILAGLLLKKNYGVLATLIYLMLGLIGFPIFANGGGFAYVLMPSFGYLLGFVLAAWFVGKFKTDNFKTNIVVSIIALMLIYLVGISYFVVLSLLYYKKTYTIVWLFYYLFVIYIPGDLITVIIANVVFKKIRKII
jgi:biotin transport system substrate-specific component